MKVAIYTRVSSQEQIDGYSLSAQREICTQFAQQRGWEVFDVYEEPGRSGRSALRPVFQQMIRHAEAGMFDVILVHKLDRFSRSLPDTLGYLGKLSEMNVAFVSATEQFDFSTPFGKVILAMLGAFAQWYTDNLAAEIKKGKRERFRQGDWNGRLSWGYTTPARLHYELAELGERHRSGEIPQSKYEELAEQIEDAIERFDHLHDTAALPSPTDAPGVVAAFELYATGKYSDREVAIALTEQGYRLRGNPLNEHTVRDLLRNRFYLGEVSYGGGRLKGRKSKKHRQWQQGNHQAIISKELFQRCEDMRNTRNTKHTTVAYKYREQVYPLAGIVEDPCGITWRGMLKDGKRHYRQREQRKLKERCGMRPKSCHAYVLEQQVDQIIFALEIPEDWRNAVIDTYGQPRTNSPDVDVVKLTAKLERAKKLYIEGDLSEGEYHQIRDRIKTQIESQPADERPITDVDLEQAYELLSSMKTLWQHMTLEERKEMSLALFARLYVEESEKNGKAYPRIKAVMPTRVMSALLLGYGASDGEDRLLPRLALRFVPYDRARLAA